jgi:PII-like signaling protein
MIGNMTASGKYLHIDVYNGSTYVNNYGGAQGVGNMRYNTTSQKMEVYDGTSWQMINEGTATVRMSSIAESVLDWAMNKMNEEQRLTELAKDHPIIQDLLDQQDKINKQLKVAENLVKEY